VVHSTTQNLRQLPSNTRSSLGGSMILDYGLSYDARVLSAQSSETDAAESS